MRSIKLPVRALFAAASLLVAGAAAAEPIYGITDSAAAAPTLFRFDSATPGATTTIGALSGVVAGQTITGIDFRPSNGQLYAISAAGTSGQLYTINLATGALTTVGSGFALTGNTSNRVSIDFNPVVDAIRVVTGNGQNYRVNANTGALISQDTTLTPSGSLISDIAYTNNNPGAATTTLYAYDYVSDTIVTIGGLNGSPSPNGGALTTVGSSGVTSISAATGFDISGLTSIAYVSLDDASSANASDEFYTVNLATGALTFVGGFNLAVLDFSVARPAIVPEPESLALLAAGLVPLVAALRRRRSRARRADR